MSLLTFRFRHSRSDELPWLIELAKRGELRQQVLSPKQIVYEAAFELSDPLLLTAAISLATALVHDKKAEVFAGGQALKIPQVLQVLRCYQQSQQVEDARVYCWFQTAFRFDVTFATLTLDDDPKPLLYPCRQSANQALGIHTEQLGTIVQQVEASLLRAGTRWCPRLADLTDWKLEASAVMKGRL